MKREPTNFEALTCEIFSNIQDAMHKITPVSPTPKVNVYDENGVYNVDLFYPGKSREDFKIEVNKENKLNPNNLIIGSPHPLDVTPSLHPKISKQSSGTVPPNVSKPCTTELVEYQFTACSPSIHSPSS